MTKLDVRFWSKVSFPAGGRGCWLWTASRTWNGYGVFSVCGERVLAHRFSYSAYVGEIPRGMDIDHVRKRGCRHRNCVNPAHLEPVTRSENCLRGDSGKISGARQSAKTTCPRGHRYAGDNLHVRSDGRRECRTCWKIRAGGTT